MSDRDVVLSDALEVLDQVWDRVAARRVGMLEDEFLWEPVTDCWTVHERDGGASVDWSNDDPDPAPLTTIAWREWHIAVEALDSYSARLFGGTGSGFTGVEWTTDVSRAGEALDGAWRVFRTGVVEAGPDWLFELLGEHWGPYATSSRLALVLHAQHEVAHHGAEIALLRDLYRVRSTSRAR